MTANQLAKPGAVNILDTPIDIGRIGTDTYVVAGLTDHITPVSYTHLSDQERPTEWE